MTPEELLNSKHIEYRHSGGDLLVKCLNPEHEDNNPSMRVDKLTGNYHCFSCGYSGVIYNLFGIHRNMLDVRIQRVKDKISKMKQPRLHLPLNRECWDKEYRGIKSETLAKFDAFTIENEEFGGRIVFPIYDIHGSIACFIGRYIHSNAKPKYLIRPAHAIVPLYPAIPEPVNGSIILVEGLFDMINLYDKGLPNGVAIMTASLGKKRDKVLEKFTNFKLQGINKIYIMLDGDEAGRKGAKQIENHLKNTFMTEIIELPDGQDPGGFDQDTVTELRKYLYG